MLYKSHICGWQVLTDRRVVQRYARREVNWGHRCSAHSSAERPRGWTCPHRCTLSESLHKYIWSSARCFHSRLFSQPDLNVHCVKLHHSFNSFVRPIVFRTLDFSFGTNPFSIWQRLCRTLNPKSLVSSDISAGIMLPSHHCSTHVLDQAVSFLCICPHL